MVASKFLHDDGEEDEVFNKEWANSGQVTISRMNKLEKDFLAAIVSNGILYIILFNYKTYIICNLITKSTICHLLFFMSQDWTVLVQHQDFWERLQQLEKNVAYREVHKRRWCTYTELSCLMNSVQLITIAQTLISVSSICLATYAAGLATLLGSTLVAHFIVQSCLPGASLSSRQPTNLTSTDLTDSLINTRLQEVNDDGLPISGSENLVDYSATAETDNDDEDIVSWKWWLNSTMTWLPEYCNLESNDEVVANSTNRLCITNVDFSFNSTQTMNIKKIEKIEKTEDFAPEDYRRNVNWKEILDTTLNWLEQDWRRLHYESVFRSSELKIYY